jgi:hypothetical protein
MRRCVSGLNKREETVSLTFYETHIYVYLSTHLSTTQSTKTVAGRTLFVVGVC